MLPPIFRLKKEIDFKRIYRKGRRAGCSYFKVSYLPNFKNNSRFGVVAAAKTIKKAVRRNLAKRILRRLLWQEKDSWPKGVDLIIKINREIQDQNEAAKELKEMLTIIKNG